MTLRARLRSLVYRTLRRTLATSDGRAIATDALAGVLAWRAGVPSADRAAPYSDLGRGRLTVPETYAGTVFVTARFRTGSTLLWNIFRHVPGCVAYYEPLNERRWFDPEMRGSRLDPTHRDVTDYWREYEGLSELGEWHREDWTDRGLFMDESAWNPNLRRYLARLIARAAPSRAVLQCNRLDFRLPWIRRQFPGATLIHLYRHPRDQWCSSLVNPAAVPRDVTMNRFEPFDHFYLQRWALDLQAHFPFLSPDVETSPYRVFYFIWKLSYLFGVGYADYSLAFEDLIKSPRAEIAKLGSAAGLDMDPERLAALVTDVPVGRWQKYADDAWFRAHESACEDILAEFLHGQTGPAGRL